LQVAVFFYNETKIKMANSYRDLEIYKASFDLFVRTHTFSLKLPKYELYELGSQLRRSSDSVNSNIIEGYGRKIYNFIEYVKKNWRT